MRGPACRQRHRTPIWEVITVGEIGPPACARAAQCLRRNTMARVDAIVLGAGIVGTSIGLHLAKRGVAVALVDRRAPGEETSYGNAGVIEGNTVFPPAFPLGPDRAVADRAPSRARGQF